MIQLLIYAPKKGFDHHVPAGFIFADEVFQEADLADPISTAQRFTSELERSMHYLTRRYPQRIQVRWVDPWSLGGLWMAIRHRLRQIPVVIVNQKEIISGDGLKFAAFVDRINAILTSPNGLQLGETRKREAGGDWFID